MSNKFYCSQKFWFLSIDFEKMQTLSCCAATPSRVDLEWLLKNPGQIFNTPGMIRERQQMLTGKPVSSCYESCWKAEEQGLISRRLSMNSQELTHTNVIASPKTLNIMVGNDCNLTCSYCCKQYSSAWSHDIVTNGEYQLDTKDDRYILNQKDRVLIKISQKEISKSFFNRTLLDEIQHLCQKSDLDNVIISGGEPFLYLGLNDLIERLPPTIPIEIYSGLGVDPNRFRREIGKICKNNIKVVVSAENTGRLYEFNRYGNDWARFTNNLACLDEHQIKYHFHNTLANITLFGLVDFFKFFEGKKITYQFCTDPDFLTVNLLDPASKERLLDTFQKNLPQNLIDVLSSSMSLPAEDSHRINLKKFLYEFSFRRNISMQIFPSSFIQWIDNV